MLQNTCYTSHTGTYFRIYGNKVRCCLQGGRIQLTLDWHGYEWFGYSDTGKTNLAVGLKVAMIEVSLGIEWETIIWDLNVYNI